MPSAYLSPALDQGFRRKVNVAIEPFDIDLENTKEQGDVIYQATTTAEVIDDLISGLGIIPLNCRKRYDLHSIMPP